MELETHSAEALRAKARTCLPGGSSKSADAGGEAQICGESCESGIAFTERPVVGYRSSVGGDKSGAARFDAVPRERGVLEGMKLSVSLARTQDDFGHAAGAFESVAAELARH